MGAKNWKWQYAAINAYHPLISVKGWKKCKKCKEFPRIWVFDNGCYAKCCCSYTYDPAPVQSESINSVYKRMGNTENYSRDNLKTAWNKFVTTGIEQNILPEGIW